jgi:hypothetical protein
LDKKGKVKREGKDQYLEVNQGHVIKENKDHILYIIIDHLPKVLKNTPIEKTTENIKILTKLLNQDPNLYPSKAKAKDLKLENSRDPNQKHQRERILTASLNNNRFTDIDP